MEQKAKFVVRIAVLALVLLTLPVWSQDEEEKPGLTAPIVKIGTPAGKKELAKVHVGLRFQGGLGYLGCGDVNSGLAGLLDVWTYGLFPPGAIRTGEYKPVHAGFNGGADVLLYFQPRWGLILGAEYLQSSRTSEVKFNIGSDNTYFTFAPRVSAIPLKLGLFADLPLGEKLNLFLQGGAGYYLGRFHYELSFASVDNWRSIVADTEAKNIGCHGGAALELKLSKKLFLFVEALGRYARLSGFSGTAIATSPDEPAITNRVIIYFAHVNMPEGRFHFLYPTSTFPDDPSYSEVREAVVDFSGFSARAGLRIRF